MKNLKVSLYTKHTFSKIDVKKVKNHIENNRKESQLLKKIIYKKIGQCSK